MKAKELSIGNLVKDEKGNLCVLLSLGLRGPEEGGIAVSEAIGNDSHKSWMDAETYFHGVAIDHQLMLRLGYEQKGSVENTTMLPSSGDNGFDGAIIYGNISSYPVFYYQEKWWFVIDQNTDDFGANYTSLQVEFINDLQNTYRIFTKTDLIAK